MSTPMRARVVCVDCHARKVKCDLGDRPDGVCHNCRRLNQACVRRDGARKRRGTPPPKERQRGPPRSSRTSSTISLQRSTPSRLAISQSDAGRSAESTHRPTSAPVDFCSAGMPYEHDKSIAAESTQPSSHGDSVIELDGESPGIAFPRQAVMRAWVDAYVANVYHYCPVTDQEDLSTDPTVTQITLAVFLLGNMTRHNPSGSVIANRIYEKVKGRVMANRDLDWPRTLKTLCLISNWDTHPTENGYLDGTWHWVGIAMRLALQTGLHREASYANRTEAASLRRAFWFLHNSDAFLTVFCGRPPLLRPDDYSTKLPDPGDFSIPGTQALVFVESCKICKILARIYTSFPKGRPATAEIAEVDASLASWVGQLPSELRLYDEVGRRKEYYRPASELLVQYFAAIVMSEVPRYPERAQLQPPYSQSLVAASCAVSLYDEIDCRDESARLVPMHGLFCMALAVPLICHRPASKAQQAARKEKIGVLRSILVGLRGRSGYADIILGKIERLQKQADEWAQTTQPLQGLDVIPSARGEWSLTGPRDLFPFPNDMCDAMDLLDDLDATSSMFSANYPDLDDGADEGAFDFSFMDFFNMDSFQMDYSFDDGIGQILGTDHTSDEAT